MDCETCALEGQAGEATTRCAECGEWICNRHAQFRDDGLALCPACFEAQEDEKYKEQFEERVSEDIEGVE